MITFLTIAVCAQTIAIAILWVALRQIVRNVAALAVLAGKTLEVTDALGGVNKSIMAAIWPVKSSDELKNMN